MEKIWELRKDYNSENREQLSRELFPNRDLNNNNSDHTCDIVVSLLLERGISSYDEANKFFNPKIENLHDPFLFEDMEKAVIRIEDAISKNENILIYGDYDVDGTTSVALLYSYLENTYKANIEYYIPDRYKEGYGVSFEGIFYAIENNFTLVVCLDCGIKDKKPIDFAAEKGIDVIICDHHLPDEGIANAHSIINPKLFQTKYPYKELCGCGIAFKLIQAISIKRGDSFETIRPYLDLVAVAISADVVPLTGENRIMSYHGLKVINTDPRLGIKALLKYNDLIPIATFHNSKLYFNREITSHDLGFFIGPRINAAGRITSAKEAVNLLICKDVNNAYRISGEINNHNEKRKELDRQMSFEAMEMVDNKWNPNNDSAIVLYKDTWHKGVVGIVAARLVDKYHKPTIIFTKSDKKSEGSSIKISGSARSIKGFDIYQAIEACEDLLDHFGGHRYAAGLTLKQENLSEFILRFNKEVEKRMDEIIKLPTIKFDAQIGLNDITDKLLRILKRFAPFGEGNNNPLFLTKKVVDTGLVTPVGENHIRFSAINNGYNSKVFPCIAFQQGEYYQYIKRGYSFDMIYQIEENFFSGRTITQLNVQDIKLINNK
ncbi:MAG: single-stranded-DNA-specific exonuclease RecJ [Bacteroidales bacterium]|jgi:single-stranded-DNA-specific exonuclease|nr:single-stranded-DNA-specific exonuclease RecJ [Bacteroidales bacterium]